MTHWARVGNVESVVRGDERHETVRRDMNSYAALIIAKDHIRSMQNEAAESRRARSAVARGRAARLDPRTLAHVLRAAAGQVAGRLLPQARSPKVRAVGRG
jgi:hypothetical protein